MSGGGRTLGKDESEPLPEAWAQRTNSQPRIGRIGGWPSSSSGSGGPRIASLHDLASSSSSAGASQPGGQASHGPEDDVDDDDDDDSEGKDEAESWFAGGERSGLSISNPDRARVPGGNMVRDLLRRAAEAGPPQDETISRPGIFSGGGHVLGGDEVESAFIPDPNAPAGTSEMETAVRHLTFWRDGFSVEDGELMRYDDPANDRVLSEIHAGLAPPHILNVQPGQSVELRVTKRLTDEYVAAPKRAFSGTGNRLGSPVPVSTSGAPASMPGSFPSGGSAAPSIIGNPLPRTADRESISARFEVNQALPTTSVQIRLADGTRMVCRMNLTHTVQDLRNFINASRPENAARPYSIGTTFPNRILEDSSVTIEAAGLVNSVIVQRWV